MKALVVEDELEIARNLCSALESAGMVTDHAATRADAEAALAMALPR